MRRMFSKTLALGALTAVAAVAVPATASASSSCWYSARGCVSVQGYYKPSTRTYVNPYFRSYPSYTYRLPKLPSYSYTPRYW